MDLIISLTASFFLFLILSKVFKSVGLPLNGRKTHPFSLFVLIQFCLLSFPGVIMVSFLGYDSPRYSGISGDTRFYIGLWYFYSVFIFFITLYFLFSVSKVKFYSRNIGASITYKNNIGYVMILVCLAILFLGLKIFLSRKAPIYYLLSGDATAAYAARVDIQTNPQDYYLPYISNIVSLLSIYQFYFIYYFYNFSDRKTITLRLVTVISFFIASFEVLYETQKAPFIFLLLGVFFIGYLKRQKIKKLVISLSLILCCVVVLQSVVNNSNMLEGLNSSADRFLLGQNQGFYHIINSIAPDSKYWFNGFYFIERLDEKPPRADVDVIPYLNIYSNSNIVNVNSYYLGEAWSMFGYYGLVFSPIIVAFVVFFFIKFLDMLIQYKPIFFIPYSIYVIPEFRLNQSFTYFLYAKDYIFKLLMMIVIIFFILLIKSLLRKRV